MPATPKVPATSVAPKVRAYLAALPPAPRRAVKALIAAIKAAAPGAEPVFSYGIPGFRYQGKVLAWCAGWREHASVYPLTAGMRAAAGPALAKYATAKGTTRFPLDAPLPLPLVRKMVRARAAEIRAAR